MVSHFLGFKVGWNYLAYWARAFSTPFSEKQAEETKAEKISTNPNPRAKKNFYKRWRPLERRAPQNNEEVWIQCCLLGRHDQQGSCK